jgi:hypothetical protein
MQKKPPRHAVFVPTKQKYAEPSRFRKYRFTLCAEDAENGDHVATGRLATKGLDTAGSLERNQGWKGF